jgi:Flp pilus assembly pilin Flp
MKNKRSAKEHGQGLVEYALILVLVSSIVAVSLHLTGTSIREIFTRALCEIQGEEDCQAQVFLEEEFSEETEFDFSSWETGLWRKKNNEWWLEDGKLVSDKDASILFDQIIDGAYSVLISGVDLLNESNKKQGVSLHFNSSYEDKNFSGYALQIVSEKKGDFIYFQEYSKGKPIKPDLTKKLRLPLDFNWDNPVDIQVDVQGDTFTGYVNGQMVIQAQDSTYSQGQVGIASGKDSEISVDAITVQSLED